MRKFIFTTLAGLLLLSGNLRADEGMWLLSLINKNYAEMKKQGLKLTADDIYSINKSSIKDAIVIFGGGCTGEIISKEGLLLTNHHCGYNRIQQHSSVENNYLKNGFWAMSKTEELINPGLSVRFLEELTDVSAIINKGLNDEMTEEERNEKIKNAIKELTEDKSKDKTTSAMVKSFFGGNNYYLLVYKVYKDVRLVGAPPSSIGKFGGETDNWMWPRHTGDFSLFRVYMSPDGEPAAYSPDNVPYQPKHFLPVSLKGVKKNDFAMVLGNPGSTERYMTSYELDEVMNITNSNRIKIRGVRQEILKAEMNADPVIKILFCPIAFFQ